MIVDNKTEDDWIREFEGEIMKTFKEQIEEGKKAEQKMGFKIMVDMTKGENSISENGEFKFEIILLNSEHFGNFAQHLEKWQKPED